MIRKKKIFLEKIRSHGIEKSNKFFNYQVNKLGFNYRLSDLNCALGLSQLKKLDSFVKKRKILVDYYKKRISHLKPYIKAIKSYEFCLPAWHLFVVLIDFKKIKINKIVFAKKLLSAGIGSQVHYVPLVLQPLYKNEIKFFNYKGAKKYYEKCLSLPLSVNMNLKDIDYIIINIKKIIKANLK